MQQLEQQTYLEINRQACLRMWEVEMLISSIHQTKSSILMKDYLGVSKTGVIKVEALQWTETEANLYKQVSTDPTEL
jgi:hypothetical protein